MAINSISSVDVDVDVVVDVIVNDVAVVVVHVVVVVDVGVVVDVVVVATSRMIIIKRNCFQQANISNNSYSYPSLPSTSGNIFHLSLMFYI